MFKFSIRSELTRKYYERRIRTFLDFIEFQLGKDIEERCNAFADQGRKDISWPINKIITFLQFQKQRAESGDIAPSTLSNFVKALKIFCEVSDISVPWKRIARGLPRPRMASNDRAPTIKEIQKLIEYPDRRIKPIVYIMTSSGIRIGAFDYLNWKHISPIKREGKIIAAKIIVYQGDPEQYFSFLSPEALFELEKWISYRKECGEEITPESWIMRNIWDRNKGSKRKPGIITEPRRLQSQGVKRIMETALWTQGLGTKLEPGKRRHDFQADHGLRKFFKTRCELASMMPINIEILMGHCTATCFLYYRNLVTGIRIDANLFMSCEIFEIKSNRI